MDKDIKFLLEKLKDKKYLVVLTGAGVSAESGIPTFRGTDGLWKEFKSEELATPQAFSQNPELVWKWYEHRREIIKKAEPNPAHLAIARLEELFPEFMLITQNIDNLHRKAGNKKIVELHGNIFRYRCSNDGRIFTNLPESDEIPPRCECGGYIRPDVVWFGESLPEDALNVAFQSSSSCDVMFVVGTSALVQPAASLPALAKRNGSFLVEINLEPTPISSIVDKSFFAKAGEILPEIVTKLCDTMSS